MEKTEQTAQRTGKAAEPEIEAQLRRIREMDPKIATVADILALDTADSFRSYVHRGLDFADAYLLANRERLLAEADERAGERRRRAAKAHLQPTETRGEGSRNVPAAELRLYRELLPELSEAEIRRSYNDDRRKMRG